jgi:hypothetical protein
MLTDRELAALGLPPPRPRLCWRLQCTRCGATWDAYGVLRDQRCERCDGGEGRAA